MESDVLKEVCNFLDLNNESKAEDAINRHYPFQKIDYLNRSHTKSKILEIFLRDGFIDRYSGNKLIFPPVLRLLSQIS
ncbi:hypothetical protein ACIQ34_00120 [Ureibacillus sp. NPDC094379]